VNAPHPTAGALPTASVVTHAKTGPAADLAALLRVALSGYDTIDLIDQDYAPVIDSARHFNFNLLPVPRVDGVLVQIENPGTGKVLFSRVLSSDAIASANVQDSITELLGSLVPQSGRLFAFLEENGLQSPLVNCLLRYNEFYQDPIQSRHAAAYRCFDALAGSGRGPAIVYALLATLQVEAIIDRYDYPDEVSFDTARALARRAIRVNPTSAAAHRAYGYLQARTGDTAEAVRWMRKAYELNAYDPGMAAAYGFALIASGAYHEGETIMRRAVETTSAHSTWWDYNLFIAAFMCGDTDTAYRASEALIAPGKPYYLGARLIAAHAKGKDDLAESLRRQLREDFPAFSVNPRPTYAARHASQELIDRLVAALAAAGLGGAG
jgi:tetratricopeptide (TPR) repeat protein